MSQFCIVWGNTYGFYFGKLLTFTLNGGTDLNNYIILASIDVWQSYFTHTCCQIHFALFCFKLSLVAIYALFLGKIGCNFACVEKNCLFPSLHKMSPCSPTHHPLTHYHFFLPHNHNFKAKDFTEKAICYNKFEVVT